MNQCYVCRASAPKNAVTCPSCGFELEPPEIQNSSLNPEQKSELEAADGTAREPEALVAEPKVNVFSRIARIFRK
ncbi:MAG: hypothetical protein FWH04_01720 [Oscillospiraceae bacterium]|nr:hypothetical protein [Oscillospiraceae bacterium]